MRQGDVHTWPPDVYLELDCPDHPRCCQTQAHEGKGTGEGFLGRRSSQGEEYSFPVCPTRWPERGISLVHFQLSSGTLPPHTIACTIPASSNVLSDTSPNTSKAKLKFLHPQETSSNRNVTRTNVRTCTWVPERRGCGFTYFVREGVRAQFSSGFCVRQRCEGATKNEHKHKLRPHEAFGRGKAFLCPLD